MQVACTRKAEFALRDHCFMAKASPGTGSYNYLDMAWQFLNAKGFNR